MLIAPFHDACMMCREQRKIIQASCSEGTWLVTPNALYASSLRYREPLLQRDQLGLPLPVVPRPEGYATPQVPLPTSPTSPPKRLKSMDGWKPESRAQASGMSMLDASYLSKLLGRDDTLEELALRVQSGSCRMLVLCGPQVSGEGGRGLLCCSQ